jgi:sulfatase modifying factor 1
MKKLISIIVFLIVTSLCYTQSVTLYNKGGVEFSYTETITQTFNCAENNTSYKLVEIRYRISNTSGKLAYVEYDIGVTGLGGNAIVCAFNANRNLDRSPYNLSFGTILKLENGNEEFGVIGGWVEMRYPPSSHFYTRFYDTAPIIATIQPSGTQNHGSDKITYSIDQDDLRHNAEDPNKASELEKLKEQQDLEKQAYQNVLYEEKQQQALHKQIADQNKSIHNGYISQKEAIQQQNIDALNKIKQKANQQLEADQNAAASINSALEEAFSIIKEAYFAPPENEDIDNKIVEEKNTLSEEYSKPIKHTDPINTYYDETDYKIRMYNLGADYFLGRGGEVDYAKAFQYLKISATTGTGWAPAWIFLGVANFYGDGTPVNYTEALNWLIKAKNTKEGMFYLGLMYEEGLGVMKDAQKANEWYLKASEHGYDKASEKFHSYRLESYTNVDFTSNGYKNYQTINNLILPSFDGTEIEKRRLFSPWGHAGAVALEEDDEVYWLFIDMENYDIYEGITTNGTVPDDGSIVKKYIYQLLSGNPNKNIKFRFKNYLNKTAENCFDCSTGMEVNCESIEPQYLTLIDLMDWNHDSSGNEPEPAKILLYKLGDGLLSNKPDTLNSVIQKPIIEWVNIPAGSSIIGSPLAPDSWDIIQHKVILNAFKMSKYEVTVEQYKAFVDATGYMTDAERGVYENGSTKIGSYKFQDGGDYSYFAEGLNWKSGLNDSLHNNPVTCVSWTDANAFAEWMGCRLPTETEWEYACRAGTTTRFYTGSNITTSQANYDGRYPYGKYAKGEFRGKPISVGSLAPSAWGLFDMHGNVSEWCSNWFDGGYPGVERMYRGGNWTSEAERVRSAQRGMASPSYSSEWLGFRLVSDK